MGKCGRESAEIPSFSFLPSRAPRHATRHCWASCRHCLFLSAAEKRKKGTARPRDCKYAEAEEATVTRVGGCCVGSVSLASHKSVQAVGDVTQRVFFEREMRWETVAELRGSRRESETRREGSYPIGRGFVSRGAHCSDADDKAAKRQKFRDVYCPRIIRRGLQRALRRSSTRFRCDILWISEIGRAHV